MTVTAATFSEIAQASDGDLAQTCSVIVLMWGLPLSEQDVNAIESIVTVFDDTGVLTSAQREQLIAIVHRLLAPVAN